MGDGSLFPCFSIRQPILTFVHGLYGAPTSTGTCASSLQLAAPTSQWGYRRFMLLFWLLLVTLLSRPPTPTALCSSVLTSLAFFPELRAPTPRLPSGGLHGST